MYLKPKKEQLYDKYIYKFIIYVYVNRINVLKDISALETLE